MAARQLPKPKELAAWLTPRRPQLDPTARRLAQAYTVHDLRRLAARRTPKAIFDYVDGSAEYELTLRRAWRLFRRVELVPQILQDVRGIDPSANFLGQTANLPWVLSPAGLTGAIRPGGEVAVARSAARFGVPYGLSQYTNTAVETVAAQAPGAHLWMGAVMPRPDQRDQAKRFFDRARQAGCDALVVTLDIDTPGSRFRDRRNGLSFPPRLSPAAIADAALHPAWWLDFLSSGPIDLPHTFLPDAAPPADPLEPSNAFQTVDDFAWLVQVWGGPVIAKGLNTAQDARLVVDAGAAAVVICTNTGRQDQGPLALRELPAAVAEVGQQVPVFLDGGVMHGIDIVAALALGAKGVFLSRAYLYGLMAGGERGVDRANELLREQLVRAMAYLGVTRLDQLKPSHIRLPRPAHA